MFQLTLLLVAVTVAAAADTTRPTTTRPTTTFRPTTGYVPGCESQFSWPMQHALGESWHEQFEGFCQDCVCLATGKVCEPCPPRGCYRPFEILAQYGHELAAGESAIIELRPGSGECVLCHCQNYFAQCNDFPCDGIIA
ncbi:Hypp7094 [Branchiostoma lanceolatum]|uniref:Hypp7094 protein n=1 Tax=Branchiostoma lanceolatum TaxID=7740 RepID=A0A8K0E952_BRALA|nr:Hypp7094 [Branchiostoma lanceolatum]